MRELRYVKAGTAQADTGQTTIVTVPPWARHSIWHLQVTAVAGTTPLTDFKFQYVIPKHPGAVAVATTTAGDGSNDEVQTVTLTGGPTEGTWTLTWTGVAADISVTTRPMRYNASAAEVNAELRHALLGNGTYGPADIVATRAGTGTSGDPYVYTLTFSGATVDKTDVDAVTVTDTGLYTYTTDTVLDFAGWDGITQIAGTTAGTVVVHVGPFQTADDTGAIYGVLSALPEKIAAKLTFDRTSANETYTYSLYAVFTS